jgi:uncharacterized protein YdeI (YjbR/CyaY-like superfamily)
MEKTYNDIPVFYAATEANWHAWLLKNHSTKKAVWLVIFKKTCATPCVYYPQAVNQALCFGWVDSKPNKRDDNSYYQFFTPRNTKSNWSKVNKDKVAKLITEKQMHQAGFKAIEIAKNNGTWDALNNVDNLILPDELAQLFVKNKIAKNNWDAFPTSAKRGILEWILNAKQTATITKRITETVTLAQNNIRANQWTKK